MMGLREQIEEVEDVRIEPCPVKEWPGIEVFVRTMIGPQLDAFIRKEEPSSLTEIAVACMCDAEGNFVFDNADQLNALKKSAGAIKRIADAGSRLNGLTEEAREEMEGNS